jgi:hypothetical protein
MICWQDRRRVVSVGGVPVRLGPPAKTACCLAGMQEQSGAVRVEPFVQRQIHKDHRYLHQVGAVMIPHFQATLQSPGNSGRCTFHSWKRKNSSICMSALALGRTSLHEPRSYLFLLLSCTSQIRDTIVRAQSARYVSC